MTDRHSQIDRQIIGMSKKDVIAWIESLEDEVNNLPLANNIDYRETYRSFRTRLLSMSREMDDVSLWIDEESPDLEAVRESLSSTSEWIRVWVRENELE